MICHIAGLKTPKLIQGLVMLELKVHAINQILFYAPRNVIPVKLKPGVLKGRLVDVDIRVIRLSSSNKSSTSCLSS